MLGELAEPRIFACCLTEAPCPPEIVKENECFEMRPSVFGLTIQFNSGLEVTYPDIACTAAEVRILQRRLAAADSIDPETLPYIIEDYVQELSMAPTRAAEVHCPGRVLVEQNR